MNQSINLGAFLNKTATPESTDSLRRGILRQALNPQGDLKGKVSYIDPMPKNCPVEDPSRTTLVLTRPAMDFMDIFRTITQGDTKLTDAMDQALITYCYQTAPRLDLTA
jgi:hypothetical protein